MCACCQSKTPSKGPKSSSSGGGGAGGGFSLDKLEAIKKEREARRKAQTDAKTARADKAKAYADAGIVGDIDFMEMIAVGSGGHVGKLAA